MQFGDSCHKLQVFYRRISRCDPWGIFLFPSAKIFFKCSRFLLKISEMVVFQVTPGTWRVLRKSVNSNFCTWESYPQGSIARRSRRRSWYVRRDEKAVPGGLPVLSQGATGTQACSSCCTPTWSRRMRHWSARACGLARSAARDGAREHAALGAIRSGTRNAKWARGSRSQTHRRAAKGGFTQDDGKVERRAGP